MKVSDVVGWEDTEHNLGAEGWRLAFQVFCRDFGGAFSCCGLQEGGACFIGSLGLLYVSFWCFEEY